MKILITGGHFSPAYTLINKLLEKGDEVALAGRRHSLEGEDVESLEYRITKDKGLPFFEIRAGRLQRKITVQTLPSLLKTSTGFLDAYKAIKTFKPDVVLVFGGYIAFPVAYVAYLLKIPIVVHEQTQNVGLSNRFIAPVATKICISFKSSEKYFLHSKIVYTGNPIRPETFDVDKEIDVDKSLPIIYITGGSTGSHQINSVIGSRLEQLLEKYTLVHQTGDSREFNDFKLLEEKKEKLPSRLKNRYILKKFVLPSEIGYIYKISSMVISRAGINTCEELLALGKPCLMLPLSHGQTNEQLENAMLIKRVGIGEYLHGEDITSAKVEETVDNIMKNIEEYKSNKKVAEVYVVKDADKKILKVVEQVYAEKNG